MALIVLLGLSATLLALPPSAAAVLVEEHGFIESLTVAIWLAGAAVSFQFAFGGRVPGWEWLFGGVVMSLFAARELGLQTAFTSWSVGRPAHYVDPEIGLDERLLALVVVVLPAVVSILGLLVRTARRFLPAWRRCAAWTLDLPIWMLMLVTSQIFDKSHKIFPHVGLEVPVLYARMFEETLEMVLAVFALATLLPFLLADGTGPAVVVGALDDHSSPTTDERGPLPTG